MPDPWKLTPALIDYCRLCLRAADLRDTKAWSYRQIAEGLGLPSPQTAHKVVWTGHRILGMPDRPIPRPPDLP